MKRSWARRTAELHDELAAIAQTDLRWWLLAGAAAAVEPWGKGGEYVLSDATPTGDTFIGYRAAAPINAVADAIARAEAARIAIRELDGQLPEQPLAVTLRIATDGNSPLNGGNGDRSGNGNGNGDRSRSGTGNGNGGNGHSYADGNGVSGNGGNGHSYANGNGVSTHRETRGAATFEPSRLEIAAFAIGDRCIVGRLDDPDLESQLAAVARGAAPLPWQGPTPFVCVSLGDDAVEVARHGHRRAWRSGVGPWLGLGRAGELATVSTSHMVVDGYGHARIAGRIAELVDRERGAAVPLAGVSIAACDLPPLATIAGAIPLGVAWRELPHPAPRALPLAYALGRVLHRAAGRPAAKFSPTFQIPIAPGDRDDPMRTRRRVVPGIVSVRFDAGAPEPYDVFAERARAVLAREATGAGLSARLLAAARGAPAPLAWKRKSLGATRARWLDRFADVIGGRGCLSKITIETPLPSSCAVSSPARLVTPEDPLGGCVITILEDADHSAITACGSGLAGTSTAARELLDELLALL